jgi:hypothetical protein
MATYIAQVRWAGEKTHSDYATITIEEYDFSGRLVSNLEDPFCPDTHKELIFSRFKQIAAIQNGGYPMEEAQLVAVYRVEAFWTRGNYPFVHNEYQINFKLKCIFRFDGKGNPTRV